MRSHLLFQHSVITRVQVGRGGIPVQRVTLRQDQTRQGITLWREAAVDAAPQLGDNMKFTHLKVKSSDYGLQLHSTTYTAFEKTKATAMAVKVSGVMDGRAGIVTLLLDDGTMLDIEKTLWVPFDEELKKGPVSVNVTTLGKSIVEIGAKAEEL
ncbi:uncharacterized protein LOC108876754 [Lates japonicus]|uniref:Uncharacterized protein n=1 Tax=Lates japonicus TaxID=270547 RepID=A0AAD3RGB5_LATJO|nr:uncharacterized protein AKAME5_001834500 [Lates japonicus]